MVIIELAPLLIWHVVVGFIITVVMDNGNILTEPLNQLFCQGALPASSAACYSYNNHIVHIICPPRCFL